MLQRQCDRCGKFIVEYDDNIRLSVCDRQSGEGYDLCRDCDAWLLEQIGTMRKKMEADLAQSKEGNR